MSSNAPALTTRPLRALLLGGTALCGAVVVGMAGSATAAALVMPTQTSSGTNLASTGTTAGTINVNTLVGVVVTPGTVSYTAAFTGNNANSRVATADITLAAPRTIIDWNGFTMSGGGGGSALNFHFNGGTDIVINRTPTGIPINVGAGNFVNGYVGSGTGTTGGNIWFLSNAGVFLNGTVTANGVLASNNISVVDLNLLSDPLPSLKVTELAAASSLIDISGAGSATGATINNTTGAIVLSGTIDAGSSGTVNLISQTTGQPGVISETGSGLINAATLTGTSVGGTTLNGANTIINLGVFANSGAGGFALTDAQALNVNGAVNAGTGGNLTLTTTGGGGNLTLASGANLTADATHAVNLVSSGSISQSGGVISAGTLTGTSTGGAILNDANLFANLGAFTNSGTGAVSITDNQAMTVTGTVAAGAGNNLTLATTGALTLNGNVTVDTTHTLTLTSAGAITQGGGEIIRTGTLTGSSTGGTVLNNANLINNLGAFANSGGGGFALTDNRALNVNGTVGAGTGGGLNLTTTTGAITLAGGLTTDTADTVTLTSAGAITQSSGVITTGTLTGSSSGGATFNDANLITNLGAFTNSGAGGFALTDAQALTVNGAVNAGGGNLTITTTTGDLGLAATGAITSTGAHRVTLHSAGALTETAGGTITTGQDLTLVAGTTINLATAPTVSRDYSVTAQTFAGAELAVTAGRDFTVDSLAAGGLTLSNTQNFSAVRNLTVTSAGALNTSAATLTANTAGGSLTLQSGGGGGLTVGALAAAGNQVTLTSAGILSQSGGIITADTLTGSSAGGATLNGANLIANLGAFINSGAGTIAFNDSVAFNITGAVNPGAGNALNLTSVGTLNETGAGAIVATTFTGSSVGGATLRGSNQIANLGAFTNTGAGGLDLLNGVALSITGAVNAATVNIDSTATLAQSGGVITATTFSGSSVGGATLNGANLITNLGAFTNSGSGGFALTNAQALNVVGPVDAGSGNTLSLTTTSGGETLNGAVGGAGETVHLVSAGTITQPSGAITGALTGSSVGSATFTSSNAVSQLGAFVVTGGGVLTLSDAVPNLDVTGGVIAAGSTVTLSNTGAAGTITETTGAITAGSLSATSTAGVTLSGPNAVTTLTTLANSGSGDLAFTDTLPLTINSAISAGSGNIVLRATGPGADLTVANALSTSAGFSITLSSSAGAINEILPGSITSGQDLILSAGTSISLLAAPTVVRDYSITAQSFLGPTLSGTAGRDFTVNALTPLTLTALQSFTAVRNLTVTSTGLLDTSLATLTATGGSLHLTGGNGLIVGSTVVTAGATTFTTTAGNITLSGAVNAAGQILTIQSAGTVFQGAGSVTAASLTGSSAGFSQFIVAATNIGAIGNYSAGGFFEIFDTTPNLAINGLLNAGGPGVFLINNGVGNMITQAPASVITSGTLYATSPGGISLTGQNLVATLTTFSNGGGTGNLLFTDAQALNVTGPITAGTGNVTLATTQGGALTLSNSVSASVVNLNATGAISQAVGVITATTLNGTSVGGATLNDANLITNLGAFTNSGASGFALTNNQALNVAGPVDAGSGNTLSITTTTGGQTLNGAIGGAGETVILISAGTITQPGGAITGVLTGSSIGLANFTGANMISTLGNFNTNGGAFDLNDATSLAITGAVTAAGAAVTLNINPGAITETGSITAASLTATATTGANLTGANNVTTLAGLSSPTGDLGFVDAGPLTISAPLNAASGNVTVGSTTPGALLTLNANLSTDAAHTVTVTSLGAISQTGGVIITGTLAGSSVGAASFGDLNQIGALNGFTTGGGNLTLNDGLGLTVFGAINAGAGTVTLTDTGSMAQDVASVITAATLTGSSGAAANFAGNNHIATLGAFTAGGDFTLVNAQNLTLAGALSAIGHTVTLDVAGQINGNAGAISANTLTGTSVGGALFEGSNQIFNLGAFTNTGGNFNGFGLVVIDGQALNVSGAITAGAGNALGFQTNVGAISLNGALNAAGSPVELFSAAGITQTAPITAGVLLGASHGDAIFSMSGNQIGSLGGLGLFGQSGFNTNGGNLTLADASNLTVQNAINAGAGTVTLTGAGSITQDLASIITAGTLTGSSSGGASFGGANQIAALGAFTNNLTGGFSLTDARALTVNGAVTAGTGALTLVTTGVGSNLAINAALLDPGQTVTLNSSGTITETGSITAATLTGSSNGGATLTGANAVGTLGAFTNTGAGGFTFVNNQSLSVGGAIVAGTGGVTVTTTAGNLTLNAPLSDAGQTVTLNSAGTISQGTGDIITAATLTGASNGGTTLTQANLIGALGAFTNAGAGNFSLTNAQALNVTGPVDAGAGNTLLLTTTLGALSLNGNLTASGGTVDLTSAGTITQSAGVITAATLTGQSNGAASLGDANQIGTLNGFTTGGGDLTLNDALALTVQGAINAGAGTVTLTDSGSISANAATITAAVLTGSSVGGASFANSGNMIGAFNGFSNTGGGAVVLSDGEALGVNGLTNVGGDATLTTSGALTLTGAINVGGANTLNANAGGTIAAAGAPITAGTLNFNSVGGAAFTNATNHIGTLGSFTNTGGGLVALTDAQALTVNGLNGVGSDVTLTTTVGGLTLAGAINLGGANTLTTVSAGTIAADAATITAGTLTGSSNGAASFGGANQISALNSFATGGGNLTLNDAASLAVLGAINAGAGTVTLTDSGTITQDAASVITAGTLTGSSSGGASLTGANQFDSLAGFTNAGAGGIAVTDAKASGMAVTSAVDAGGGNLTLTTSGAMILSADLKTGSAQVNLVSGGSITQSAGLITTGILAGSSVGGTTLNDANMIGALGAFTNTGSGGFSLSNARALNLLGGATVNAGPGALSITTTTGDISATPANSLVAGTDILITSAGAAGIDGATAGGDVSVKGTSATTGALKAGRDVAVQATSGNVTVGSASASDDVVIVSPGLVTLNGPVGTTGGADVAGAADTLFATVSGPLNSLFKVAGQSAVFISAKTYANAGGALTGPAVGIALSDPAGMTLANATGGGGSTVIAGTLQSPNVTLFESGGNITVGDATLPSQLTNAIGFYTTGTVSVTGRFVPAVDNTVALTIGGPTASGWTPSLIKVVNDSDSGAPGPNHGSIGAATLASANGPVSNVVTFQSVTLTTSGNILMGSTQFDQILNTTTALPTDINPTIPRPPLPANTSHAVLLAANNVVLNSDGRIEQQNTGGFQATQSSGFYLTGSVTVHGYQTTGPQNLDLFGALVNPGGGLLTGPTASLSGRIVVAPGNSTFRALYRVNSCVVGQQGNCTPTGDPVVTIKPDDLLTDVLPKQVELEDVEDPTITGAPNEEIWRKPE